MGIKYLDFYTRQNINADLKDFQLQNLWVMTFEDNQELDLYITDTTLPLYNLSLERIPISNTLIPSTKNDYRTVSCTFNETVNFDVYNYHKKWLDSIYDFDNHLVKKAFHTMKKRATLQFITIKKSGFSVGSIWTAIADRANTSIVTNERFELDGVQITGIEDVVLGSDSGDPLSLTVNYEIQSVKTLEVTTTAATGRQTL